MKKTLLFLGVTFLTFSSVIVQFYSNLVFKLEIPSTTAEIISKFDIEAVSPGDSFEWQLILAKVDESLDWGQKNIAYQSAITPNSTGSGNQTVTFDVYNDFTDGDIYTWVGKITLGADSLYTDNTNTGNLVKISSKANTNDFENLKSSMYLNPSSAFTNISNDNLSNKSVKIFNVIGEKIAEIFAVDNEIIIFDIQKLSKGIYLVSADSNATA
tara:strand:- start:4581 stop:5219 length:639 start_codon:yes stop_codon:yes gene_type:complete